MISESAILARNRWLMSRAPSFPARSQYPGLISSCGVRSTSFSRAGASSGSLNKSTTETGLRKEFAGPGPAPALPRRGPGLLEAVRQTSWYQRRSLIAPHLLPGQTESHLPTHFQKTVVNILRRQQFQPHADCRRDAALCCSRRLLQEVFGNRTVSFFHSRLGHGCNYYGILCRISIRHTALPQTIQRGVSSGTSLSTSSQCFSVSSQRRFSSLSCPALSG